MTARNLIILLAAACVCSLTGCDSNQKYNLAKEDHRRAFFPQISPEAILDYQFSYRSPRGGYLTYARVILNTNADSLMIEKGFDKVDFAEESQVAQVYIDLLHATAASLVGEAKDVPQWMIATNDSPYKYMVRKNGRGEHALWWNMNRNIIYFTAIGTDNRWVTNR